MFDLLDSESVPLVILSAGLAGGYVACTAAENLMYVRCGEEAS
jgi:hypothetical protein